MKQPEPGNTDHLLPRCGRVVAKVAGSCFSSCAKPATRAILRLAVWLMVAAGLILAGADSSPAAETGIMAGMTEAHNTVRVGLGLPEMAWSDELAASAQEWAQQLADHSGCTMQHRPSQTASGPPHGENLFWASAIRQANGARRRQGISPQQVVNSWVHERQYYDRVRQRCRSGNSCGHYTQVVWQTTRRIGCGMAFCPDSSQVWVCNYDPPGNHRGQAPY